MVEVFIVLSNVSSPQRLIDTAKVVFSVKSGLVRGFVAVKVTGMAAQTGIPEVTRMAYKLGKVFIVLPTLNDFIDIIKPTKTLLVVEEGKSKVTLNEININTDDRLAIVVSGVEDGFTRQELGLGEPVTIPNFTQQLPPTASTALALHIIINKTTKT